MKKVFFLVVALFLLSSWNLSAQLDNYGVAPKSKIQVIWGPHVGWMPGNHWALPLSMNSPMGKVDIKHRENRIFPLNNIATSDIYFGIKGIIRNPQSRLGGFFFLDYRNKGFDMKYPGEDEFKTHISQAISPAAGLRLSLGNLANKFKWVLEAGAAYNYNFKYKGSFDNDLKVINNGISGIYGFGFEFSSGRRNDITSNDVIFGTSTHHKVESSKNFYWSMTLQYRQDYYDFFNNNFSSGGIQPYQGFKNNFGYIAITLTGRGSFRSTKWRY
jgi:hypothetical protein